MPGPFSYFRFYFTATNQHGVHSPFVYRFLTQGLYVKHPFKKTGKSQTVLLKCIDYFDAVKLSIPAGDAIHNKLVKQHFPNSVIGAQPFDLVYLDILEIQEVKSYLTEQGKLTNESLIFINNIRRSSQLLRQWEAVCALPEITVSIDLYYCGLLFIRREQVKQHFRIRI